MMIHIDARCKFCRKPLRIAGSDRCPNDKWKAWVNIVACNRCADFRLAIVDLRAHAHKVSSWLLRAIAGGNQEEIAAKRLKAREAFEKITKKAGDLACEHYALTNIWHSDVVDQIMDQPQKASNIVAAYCDMLRKQHNSMVSAEKQRHVVHITKEELTRSKEDWETEDEDSNETNALPRPPLD